MRSIAIDFARSSSRRWGWRPWMLTLFLIIGLLGMTYFYWRSLVLRAQLDEVNQRPYLSASKSSEDTQIALTNSERLVASAASADKLSVSSVSLDGALAAIESLRLPGVRVSSAAVDLQEGSARLEIDAADIDQVAASLALLQGANPTAAWRLVNARAAVGSQRYVAAFETRAEAAVASKIPAAKSGAYSDRERSK